MVFYAIRIAFVPGYTYFSSSTDTHSPMAPTTVPGFQTYCQVRSKLADEYATYARLFAEAVVLVTTSTVDIERLQEATRQAQERVEAARVAFEEHMASHGC